MCNSSEVRHILQVTLRKLYKAGIHVKEVEAMKLHSVTLQAGEPERFFQGSDSRELFLLLANFQTRSQNWSPEICSVNKHLQRTHYIQGPCQVLSTHRWDGPCHWVDKFSRRDNLGNIKQLELLYLYMQVCMVRPLIHPSGVLEDFLSPRKCSNFRSWKVGMPAWSIPREILEVAVCQCE